MSVAEMKNKIIHEVRNFEEPQLAIILNMIEEIKATPAYSKKSIDAIFDEAVKKYGNTLQKLAE